MSLLHGPPTGWTVGRGMPCVGTGVGVAVGASVTTIVGVRVGVGVATDAGSCVGMLTTGC